MGRSSRRDANSIASRAVDASFLEDLISAPSLRVFEDRRSFHPEGVFRQATGFSVGDGRLVDRSRVTRARTAAPNFSGHVGFSVPDRVWICARRKERREVLMARGKGGGARSRKKARRNYYSNVRC